MPRTNQCWHSVLSSWSALTRTRARLNADTQSCSLSSVIVILCSWQGVGTPSRYNATNVSVRWTVDKVWTNLQNNVTNSCSTHTQYVQHAVSLFIPHEVTMGRRTINSVMPIRQSKSHEVTRAREKCPVWMSSMK